MWSNIAAVTGRLDMGLERLLLLLNPERALDAGARAELAQQDRAINLRRARAWGPVVLALHTGLTLFYARIAVTTELERAWRHGAVILLGAATIGYTVALLCAAINRGPARAVADRIGPIINLIALSHVALLAINAQALHGNLGQYPPLLLATPFAIRFPATWFYGVAVANSAVLAAGIVAVQTSPLLRNHNVVLVFMFTLLAVIVARIQRESLVNELRLRRELERFNAELGSRVEAQTSEIRSFAMRLDEVLEVERRRLAHELHDDLGQEITALRLEVEAMRAYTRDERQLGGLQRMAGAIERSHGSVRAILESLRPRILDEEGLECAIHWLGRHHRERTACAVAVAVDLGAEPDAQVGLVAFRVAQESLNNVARHARATSVSVSLERRGDALTLEIADDGATDEHGPIRPGRGVVGMRERVSSLGGELSVTAASTGGTLVRATIPLGAKARVEGAAAAN